MFLTQMHVTPLPLSDTQWRLTAPLVFRSIVLSETITIPHGFITDFASIPEWMPLANWLLRDVGREAACLHDYLITGNEYDRADCDAVYKEALDYDPRIPSWKRWILYSAVTIYRWIRR